MQPSLVAPSPSPVAARPRRPRGWWSCFAAAAYDRPVTLSLRAADAAHAPNLSPPPHSLGQLVSCAPRLTDALAASARLEVALASVSREWRARADEPKAPLPLRRQPRRPQRPAPRPRLPTRWKWRHASVRRDVVAGWQGKEEGWGAATREREKRGRRSTQWRQEAAAPLRRRGAPRWRHCGGGARASRAQRGAV